METPLHIVTINLNELTEFELIYLLTGLNDAVNASYGNDELTDELLSVRNQIRTYHELINK